MGILPWELGGYVVQFRRGDFALILAMAFVCGFTIGMIVMGEFADDAAADHVQSAHVSVQDR